MISRINCLKRVGEGVKKYKIIDLEGKNEVTIGRNPDVTVCILSTMISRCHAVLKKNQQGIWTIKDNKSLNGVYINDRRLDPMVAYELKDGDKVQFGVSTSPSAPAEFVYQYYTALKVKQTRLRTADKTDGPQESSDCPRVKRFKTKEAQAAGPSTGDTGPPTSDSQVTSSQPDLDGLDGRLNYKSPHRESYVQYCNKLKEQEEQSKAKMAEFEAKLQEMQKLLQEKESAQSEMARELEEEKLKRKNQSKVVETLKQKEEQLQEELKRKQEALAKEKEELEAKMREELEDQLQVKEATLMEYLEDQRQALLKEKLAVEEKLQKELESALEKDKELAEELEKQKQNLEKVIEAKEAEQKLLESQLKETKQEKDRKQEEALRAREDVLSNFAELMETELQCSICNELFVKATTLNCSHGFCYLCINQWMRLKTECPVCRTAITTQMRSIVLDSYIEKMVDQFSDDMKKTRQELVEERKVQEAKFNETVQAEQAGAAGGGRGRERARRRGRGGLLAAPPPPISATTTSGLVAPPPPLGPVTISDEDEEDLSMHASENDSDNDSSEISGDEDVYYGGYGRCFNCGSRGHWANGCPFR